MSNFNNKRQSLLPFLVLMPLAFSGCTQKPQPIVEPAKPVVVTEFVEKPSYYERSAHGPVASMGSWEQVPLPPLKDRMQGVHTVLLPNGKILMANGSSFRNTLEDGEMVNGLDTRNYSAINNTAIFDPADNSFKRIDSPQVSKDPEINNDLFCSGQLHLADGDVLFAGGTQSYYGQGQFQGSKSMQLFDWVTETWSDAGKGEDGHWYPSLIPLANGQMMVISGVSYYSKDQISPWVEFYNPKDKKWTSIKIDGLPNSPWNTRLEDGTIDGLQMYPRIYPLPNDQFLLSHDGANWSVANGNPTNKTYIMSVNFDTDDKPVISFEHGPLRENVNRIYGTAVQDPNNGDILLFAGQQGPKNISNNDYGPGPWGEGKLAVNVTGDMERFTFDASKPNKGSWKTTKNFLGDTPEDARIMHYSTILPTKELLIINGGNYAYHRPLFYPILLSSDKDAPGQYRLKQMNQALEPRLYHNVSLLLPDGRVFTAGGNTSRAAIKMKDGKVDEVLLNTYKTPHGDYAFDDHGEFGIPAEMWRSEIYSPPYLHIDAPRPEITLSGSIKTNTDKMPAMGYEQEHTISVKNATTKASLVLIKLGSSTHAWDSGQRLIDLQVMQVKGNDYTFKTPRLNNQNVEGYYMLFYVSDKGQPSIAKVIQLNNKI